MRVVEAIEAFELTTDVAREVARDLTLRTVESVSGFDSTSAKRASSDADDDLPARESVSGADSRDAGCSILKNCLVEETNELIFSN